MMQAIPMDFVGKNAIDFVGKNPSLGNAYTAKNMQANVCYRSYILILVRSWNVKDGGF